MVHVVEGEQYGFTPFRGNTQQATFHNICSQDKVRIPDKPSVRCPLIFVQQVPSMFAGNPLIHCAPSNKTRPAPLPPPPRADLPMHSVSSSLCSREVSFTPDVSSICSPDILRTWPTADERGLQEDGDGVAGARTCQASRLQDGISPPDSSLPF